MIHWGTTEDVTADVERGSKIGVERIDDHGIVVCSPPGGAIVVEGTPEELLAWALDLVKRVAKKTGQTLTAPTGSTVYTLEWGDKHKQGVSVHGSHEAAVAEKARIARESWDEIADFDDVPDTPPDDDAEAARIFYDACEDMGNGTWAFINALTVDG